jgi:hypothetical protein
MPMTMSAEFMVNEYANGELLGLCFALGTKAPRPWSPIAETPGTLRAVQRSLRGYQCAK